MAKYYLRVEAVNLDYSVYDTHDISTIRGGSFMLQDAIDEAFKSMKQSGYEIEDIGTAASVGLFKIELSEKQDPNAIAQEFIIKLKKYTPAFGAFVYAIKPINKDKTFLVQLNELMAESRWQQYQNPTFVLPIEKDKEKYCEFDGLRPGASLEKKGEENKIASSAVKVRRKEGRKLRNSLFTKLTEDEPEKKLSELDSQSPFTIELDKLSKNSNAGKLDGKMAFIYIDGNRFGSIRDTLCTDEKKYLDFQITIQNHLRKPAFKRIVDFALQDKSFLTTSENGKMQIRMETLLWGGDEIEWIVPAWQAFNVLEKFYDSVNQNDQFDGIKLTHSAGVVFCHHNLPILQVRRYAHKLCEIAKKNIPDDINKITDNANKIAFLNMTSFDLIAGDIEDFLSTYYYPASYHDFILTSEQLKVFKEYLPVFKKHFPRNKLFDIINAIKNKNEDKAEETIKRVYSIVGSTNSKVLKNAIEKIISDNNRWLIAADLIDYTGDLS